MIKVLPAHSNGVLTNDHPVPAKHEPELVDLFLAHFDGLRVPNYDRSTTQAKRKKLVEAIVRAGYSTEESARRKFVSLWGSLRNGTPVPPWQDFNLADKEIRAAIKKQK